MLGVSRTSWYVRPNKQTSKDKAEVKQLQAAHLQHPFYGVYRLALHLGWNQKKARRIRILVGVHISRPGKKYKYGRSATAEISAPQNILHRYAQFKDELRP
ncbi:hypothetical protein HYS01_02245 [Candidatus Saccharibacteria bacterium]|nr:hypothetical protein [Candidatus Saccharibacteria bacterium]